MHVLSECGLNALAMIAACGKGQLSTEAVMPYVDMEGCLGSQGETYTSTAEILPASDRGIEGAHTGPEIPGDVY